MLYYIYQIPLFPWRVEGGGLGKKQSRLSYSIYNITTDNIYLNALSTLTILVCSNDEGCCEGASTNRSICSY